MVLLESRPTRARGLKLLKCIKPWTTAQSRPTRARGLKHCSKTVYSSSCPVAPHAGAWIETSSQRVDHHDHGESRPTRARGLKHDCLPVGGSIGKSRPTRARGLKHVFTKAFKKQLQVAPHAGAWIETRIIRPASTKSSCRAPRGRVD